MAIRKRETVTVLVLTIVASLAIAQDKIENPLPAAKKSVVLQKIPSSLEAMFARALESNPDLLVAEADLVQTQAKLKQVRLKVSRALIEASLHRKFCLDAVGIARSEYDRKEFLARRGQISTDELAAQRQALTGAEAAVAESEIMVRALIGIDPAAGKTPESFEEMLTLALQSNGEIALAEADLVRMDARSNQVRLRVTEEVTIAHQMRRVKQNAVAIATSIHQKMKERVKQNLLSRDEELMAFQAVIEAEAELIRIDAHLRYLLGLGVIVESGKQTGSEALPTK